LCHSTGDGRDPYIGSSDGTGNNPGLGCTGCHAELGLRAHHAVNGITQCAGCHPNDPAPAPENTMPVYYGTADTNADMPCNPDPQANINENWTIGDFEGTDNDGDNLYDGEDPDCAVAVCGDGTVDAGEACDDGNTTNGDGCENDCTVTPVAPVCGDGTVDIGEECDDGNNIDNDGCQANCVCPDGDDTDTDQDGNPDCIDGGSGCFIATAAYGSSWEPHVVTLRQFRDEYLLKNKLGTEFVEIYYRFSPPMADYIAEHDNLRSVARIGLAPLVGFSWLAMNYGMIVTLAILISMITLIVGGTCIMIRTREVN
jgi:cysteine-rich repeat protein